MNTKEATKAYASNPEAFKEAQSQLQALLARSATDPEFRQKLLTDPRTTVSEFTGHAVPESYNIVFVENKGDATIVLPDPYTPDAELSDAELETVAGGIIPIVTALFCAFVAGATID